MKLEHKFTVPAPIDTVWQALLEPERVAPCFPGATITDASGDEFSGTVKVRLGPISLQYKGSGKFTEKDETAHRTVIEASGTASGGQSTAAATVVANLAEQGEGTAVTVVTDLSVTGKPAQFGRGMIEEVGGKIIGQFADCLSKRLGPEEAKPEPEPAAAAKPAMAAAPSAGPAAAQPTPMRPVPEQAVEEIDLLDAAGGAVAKRVIPLVAGLLIVLLVIRWWRRR